MKEVKCPNCSGELVLNKEESLGETPVDCPMCKKTFELKDISVQTFSDETQLKSSVEIQKNLQSSNEAVYRYKVVEKKKKSFIKGHITTNQLERVLNSEANEGWILDRILGGETARYMGFGDKDVFLIVFRKALK